MLWVVVFLFVVFGFVVVVFWFFGFFCVGCVLFLGVGLGVFCCVAFAPDEIAAVFHALHDTQVLLAPDAGEPLWQWHIGRETDLFDQLRYAPQHVSVMMCGPEGMMHVVARLMQSAGVAQRDIRLSMERYMQCALCHCGHCQYGAQFICRDGPVFSFDRVAALFDVQGF